MFYLPFELRNQTEYCTPKGPNFEQAPLVRFSVNGTNIQLRIPRHRTNLPVKPCHSRASYDLEGLHFHNAVTGKPEWGGLTILSRIWEFYGPWFTGRLGAISFSLTIISPRNITENSSFYHPRAYESGLADYLIYRFGDEKTATENEQAWFAPTNWNPLTRLPCVAASFDVVENDRLGRSSGNMHRYLCVAITPKHLLRASFFITRNRFFPEGNEPYKKPDDWINIAPMNALADDVINSLQITLSPEAQAQQTKALVGLESATLVKEFPPLEWK